MNTKTVESLLELQNTLNITTCGDDWATNGVCASSGRKNMFNVACIMESSELIDSINWKHWKDVNKEDNLDNIVMETVDLLHFVLSIAIINNKKIPKGSNIKNSELLLSNYLERVFIPETKVTRDELIDTVLLFMKEVIDLQINNNNDIIESLATYEEMCIRFSNLISYVLSYTGTTEDNLIKTYLSKNALNIFRSANGYKEGTYIKEWSEGNEDNVHLMKLMDTYDEIPTIDIILKDLEDMYKLVLKNTN